MTFEHEDTHSLIFHVQSKTPFLKSIDTCDSCRGFWSMLTEATSSAETATAHSDTQWENTHVEFSIRS